MTDVAREPAERGGDESGTTSRNDNVPAGTLSVLNEQSGSRRRSQASVRLARRVATVGEEPLGAGVDHALPVRQGGLGELAVRPRLVVEVAVDVAAAHEHRRLAE